MDVENAYETIPYASKLHPGRHPRHIFTVASFFGVEGVVPSQSSFLEIGCGTGHALLPLALEFPDSTFRGVDASAEQIALGRRKVNDLGLSNVRLEAVDIATLSSEISKYDYILCHGVYSWVSQDLQKEILRTIERQLAERGLAYVSYNTLPGWRFRGILRDLLLSEIDRGLDSKEQIQGARAVLALFADSVGYEFERPYSLMMHAELKRIASENDAYLFHEFLEQENNPVYLKDMLRELDSAGLELIADSRMSRNGLARLSKTPAASVLIDRCRASYPSPRQQEQFLDFIFHTPFRESVLCRKGKRAQERPVEERIRDSFFAAYYTPLEGEPNLNSTYEEEFVDLAGQHVFLGRPEMKAALVALAEAWPRSMHFDALFGAVQRSSGAALTQEQLMRSMMELVCKDLIAVSVVDMPLAGAVSERPKASPLAALDAKEGCLVTNLRYQSIEIGEFERELLQLLNGSRGHQELVDALLVSLAEHGAKLHEDGVAITDIERQRDLVTTLLRDGLETLRKAALLVA